MSAARSYQVNRMLRTYGRQLTSARRLERFKQSIAAAGTEEEVRISRMAKRRMLVEQVSREIIENLVVSGSENEIVRAILGQLGVEFGETFEFHYPPAQIDMQIFKTTPDGNEEITGPAKHAVYQRLWEITTEKVNETML